MKSTEQAGIVISLDAYRARRRSTVQVELNDARSQMNSAPSSTKPEDDGAETAGSLT